MTGLVRFKAAVDRAISPYAARGERLSANGVRCICPAPGVAPEAVVHYLFPPISDVGLEELQDSSTRPTPPAYIELLRWGNGLDMFCSRLAVFGIQPALLKRSGDFVHPWDVIQTNSEYAWALGRGMIVAMNDLDDRRLIVHAWDGQMTSEWREDGGERTRTWPSLEDALIELIEEIGAVRDWAEYRLNPAPERGGFWARVLRRGKGGR